VAFLIMRFPAAAQIGVSFGLLLLTELLYRLVNVPGFDKPFVPDHNFGSYFDMLLMGKLSEGHWVAFNAVPTAAHTIWGVLAGLLLRSKIKPGRKMGILLITGLAGVAAGAALDPVTPIIKRIATTSFVITTGGVCLLALALSFWVIDVKKIQGWAKFFAIVGMNPLFIYLFTQTGGARWFDTIVRPFTIGFLGWTGDLPARILTSLVVWGLLWFLCYLLYRRKIFVRI
jgi:predicted acyltransferase